jgi:acyl transferase domain-containing protein
MQLCNFYIKALKKAELDPRNISYLEAHGTGTLLGDPIEIKAATQTYRKQTQDKQYCATGSVKGNMGHLLHAAGVGSFIKVILALQNKQIPPTLNCEKPHPRFRFEESPFYPNTKLINWEPINGRRIAAISSFGFGGTNCHLIVEGFDYAVQNHTPQKQALPLTQFSRERYWVGEEIVDVGIFGQKVGIHSEVKTEEDKMLLELLEKIGNKVLTAEEAIKLA